MMLRRRPGSSGTRSGFAHAVAAAFVATLAISALTAAKQSPSAKRDDCVRGLTRVGKNPYAQLDDRCEGTYEIQEAADSDDTKLRFDSLSATSTLAAEPGLLSHVIFSAQPQPVDIHVQHLGTPGYRMDTLHQPGTSGRFSWDAEIFKSAGPIDSMGVLVSTSFKCESGPELVYVPAVLTFDTKATLTHHLELKIASGPTNLPPRVSLTNVKNCYQTTPLGSFVMKRVSTSLKSTVPWSSTFDVSGPGLFEISASLGDAPSLDIRFFVAQ